ncbi:hypothetical protein WI23_26955 [Burkholderia oklahomensis C6786]|nr:hypothetical protein WI23_26955 [Burkholderia oklahomensis C6786]KUY62310.1 hypothetical protein WI23_09650 [Burkholderia oklahomensis C6786]
MAGLRRARHDSAALPASRGERRVVSRSSHVACRASACAGTALRAGSRCASASRRTAWVVGACGAHVGMADRSIRREGGARGPLACFVSHVVRICAPCREVSPLGVFCFEPASRRATHADSIRRRRACVRSIGSFLVPRFDTQQRRAAHRPSSILSIVLIR